MRRRRGPQTGRWTFLASGSLAAGAAGAARAVAVGPRDLVLVELRAAPRLRDLVLMRPVLLLPPVLLLLARPVLPRVNPVLRLVQRVAVAAGAVAVLRLHRPLSTRTRSPRRNSSR
jgi:hypothetical protein